MQAKAGSAPKNTPSAPNQKRLGLSRLAPGNPSDADNAAQRTGWRSQCRLFLDVSTDLTGAATPVPHRRSVLGRLSFSRPHLGDRLRLVEVRGLFREEWTKLQNAEARFKGRVAKHELTSLYCSLLSQPRKVEGTCLGSRVALAGFSFPSKPS